jgi:hypothetical protein
MRSHGQPVATLGFSCPARVTPRSLFAALRRTSGTAGNDPRPVADCSEGDSRQISYVAGRREAPHLFPAVLGVVQPSQVLMDIADRDRTFSHG